MASDDELPPPPAGGVFGTGIEKPTVRADRRLLTELGVDMEEFALLSPAAQATVLQALDEFAEHGSSITASSLVAADWKWMPVSVEQFVDDPYYLGGFTRDLFPMLRKALIEIFDTAHPPVEVILGGSIGWGKTTIAGIGILYDLYRVGCLKNPHAYYGLMPGSPITWAVYSTSKEQAADSSFSKMLTWVTGSPYFRERMPRTGKHTTRMVFSKSPILVITGSQEVHSIGKDMYGFMLDEANFLTAKSTSEGEEGRAMAIYSNAKTRMASRFQEGGGRIPGKLWLISSKRTHASFLENHIAASKATIASGLTRLYEYARWDVLPSGKYTLPRFKVEVGDRINPARMLSEFESARPGADVIAVPGEFRQNFLDDIDQAMRDIAGIATYGLSPLFRDRNALFACIVPPASPEAWVHPFTKPVISTDILDDIDIAAYFRADCMFQVRQSRHVVRRNPHAPRFIHLDLAVTEDSMGIACCHQSGWRRVKRSRADGTWYEDKAPVVDIDFMLRIEPPRGSEIDIAKARAFIISLRDLGLPIWRVSCDGWQSRDTTQILRKLDFDAVTYSVDRTDEAYMTFRQAVVEQRIRYYEYETFMREASELERDIDAGKVDHPKTSPSTGLRGGKDVADAVAGACFNALTDPRAAVQPSSGGEPTDNQDSGVRTKVGEIPWAELEKELRT